MVTKPRPMSTPSAATIAKLSTATGKFTIGKLQGRQPATAPDGGAIADYPKGWRFMPPATREQHEILKKTLKIPLAKLHGGCTANERGRCGNRGQPSCEEANEACLGRYRQKVADAHYELVIAPQVKAQEEAIARKEEEERLAVATLKMRVQELEKQAPKPTPKPTPATSYLPFAVVGIVIIVILLFLRRRA